MNTVDVERFLGVLDRGLAFILSDREQGYPELIHRMRFSHSEGFRSPELQEGDIFQRAMVTECLLDVSSFLTTFGMEDLATTAAGLRTIAEEEAQYLAGRRATDVRGGWRYFPDLRELPPDADDLGQIAQVFARVGRPDLLEILRDPVHLLIGRNLHSNGMFATWILDPEDRSHSGRLLWEAVDQWWGVRGGRDAEVTANALYGISWLHWDELVPVLQVGITALESCQRPDGSWSVEWYRDPEYGIALGLRALARLHPRSKAAAPALEYLLERQQRDGSWPGGPQATSLALYALRWAPQLNIPGEPVKRARVCLMNTQLADGSWDPSDFIIMLGGRHVYRSRVMTTALCLRGLVGSFDNTASA